MMMMTNQRQKTFNTWIRVLCTATLLAIAHTAYSQSQSLDPTIDVQGTDQSANLGAVNNMGKTIVQFLLNVVAKVVGVALAVWGVTDFAKREITWGCVKVFVSGALFFINRIILALSQMGGA